jgi:hypothetical protein
MLKSSLILGVIVLVLGMSACGIDSAPSSTPSPSPITSPSPAVAIKQALVLSGAITQTIAMAKPAQTCGKISIGGAPQFHAQLLDITINQYPATLLIDITPYSGPKDYPINANGTSIALERQSPQGTDIWSTQGAKGDIKIDAGDKSGVVNAELLNSSDSTKKMQISGNFYCVAKK